MRESLTVIGNFDSHILYSLHSWIEEMPETLWAFGVQMPACIGDHKVVYFNKDRVNVPAHIYRELSRKFPYLKFIVERVDDSFNVYRWYIQNGALAICVAEVRWLKFDWNNMREVENTRTISVDALKAAINRETGGIQMMIGSGDILDIIDEVYAASEGSDDA